MEEAIKYESNNFNYGTTYTANDCYMTKMIFEGKCVLRGSEVGKKNRYECSCKDP